MQTSKITATQIKNRERCLKSSNESPDASYLYNIAIDSIKNNKQTVREDVQRFFNQCTNKHNANLYAGRCLELIDEIKDDSYLSPKMQNLFCNSIIPFVENLDSVRDLATNRVKGDEVLKQINEALDYNHICDRIIANDNKLTKRFNFDKYIKENAYKPFDQMILTCCEMIDTYDIPSYAKMNISLEEFSYILQKNFIEYDKSRMVQLITEYFINFGTDPDKEAYRKVLSENYCISDQDLCKIKFFMEDFELGDSNDTVEADDYNPYSMGTPEITDRLNSCVDIFNQFKASTAKTLDDFKNTLENISNEDVVYQIQALPEIFDWNKNFGLAKFGNSIATVMEIFLKNIVSLINGNTKQLDTVFLLLGSEINKARDVEAEDGPLDNYTEVLGKLEDEIDMIKSTSMNVSEQNFISAKENCERVISLDEFKIFKFDNIIKYAYLVNKKLKSKEKSLFGKAKDKIKEIFASGKKWLTEGYDKSQLQEENILDCITSNFNFDHILGIYEVAEDEIPYVKSRLEAFCEEMNSSFEDKEIGIYYTNIDSLFEIHIADMSYITLTEEQIEESANMFTEAEQAYAGYLMDLTESLENYATINTSSLAEDFAKVQDTLSADGIVGIIEASKYLVNLISYSRLEEIAEIYSVNHPMDYIGNTSIKQALESWKLEDCDLDMVVETVSMLRECVDTALLNEAGAAQPKDQKKDSKVKQAVDNAKDNVKKVNETKLNFNTLRYAMESLKQKSKGAGDKAQQFSNTLNMYVEKFITSIQKLYTNDNREQIIRGSIIPSFHQLMGRLLVIGGAAGVGGAAAGAYAAKAAGVAFSFSTTGAIFTAALALYATIAASKKSTDKERALMLDEIEIEIDICEKEMSRAEANGQMKKYRALMYRRAKLKREYQRIRYNIGYKEYKHSSVVKDNRD